MKIYDIFVAFIEFLKTIDVKELIYAAAGAFIGFWLAIKGDNKQEKKKESEDAKQCIKELITELEDIKVNLINPEFNPREKCYIDPLKTPVWNGLISSNSIQCLSKQKQKMEVKRKNVIWYKHLFEVYGQIKEFNMWCNLLSEQIASSSIMIDSNQQKILDALSPIYVSLENLRAELLQSADNSDNSPDETSLNELIAELNATMAIK